MLNEEAKARLAEELAKVAETTTLDGESAARWTMRGSRPRLVCAPMTADALAAALAACDRAGAAVIPWGGGTQQGLGLTPRAADVILVTRSLNRLVEFEPANLTATVEAGLRLAELQAILGAKGQWLPFDPPVPPAATIGGLIATNPSGPCRLKVGGLRDLVIGTRVATPEGALVSAGGRVVKNVTGYDVNKLYVGALGTLGVVVEATFKVAPLPQGERTWLGIFPSATAAGEATLSLLRTALTPTGLEILSEQLAQALGLPVAEGRWALVARASGFRPAVERHLAEFAAAARKAGAEDFGNLAEDAALAFWADSSRLVAERRWSAGFLTCRLVVPPAAVGRLADQLAGSEAKPLIWAAATGAVFCSLPAGEVAGPAELVGQLRARAVAEGGALVVENWPDSAGDLDVWGPPGGPLALMRALKERFDPRGTLNPGRFVGGI